MIRVKNVSKSFKRQQILKDINLEVKEGTICGIIGRNGSGKTVLFKCICGFFLTDSGKIEVQGKEVGGCIYFSACGSFCRNVFFSSSVIT